MHDDSIKESLKNFKDKRVAILGDVMLDKYTIGEVSRISPEAPVPVVEVTSENFFLGGAAILGQALGQKG